MKTNKFVLALFMVVVLTTVIFSIVKTSYNSGNIDSSLILQNIEALSQQGEEDYNSSDCSHGAPFYNWVESFTGKGEVVEHLSDGVNGKNGVDMVYIISYRGCSALGDGTFSGSNYWQPIEYGYQEVRECKGNSGHKSIPFD